MQLDVKKFVRKIKRAKEIMPVPGMELETEGLKYLYSLLDTLTEGEGPVCVGDVDFNRFSTEDINCFVDNLWNLEQRMGEGNKIARMFMGANAKAYTPAARFF